MDDPQRGESPAATDAELVEQARAGASGAFGTLVRRYQALAVARAYRLLGDRGEAEDAAQEAFMRAYRSIHQLRKPAAFGSWLMRTVSNVARRAGSRRARRPGPLPAAHPATNPGPRLEVLDAIATLPEGEQQVLHLFYRQGHTCAEIGRLLGLKVGSVTSRLTRARQRLRELLSEDDS
ncbi:MAG: RNA polymerase sigma factor [Planctomycetota bacterium]